MKKRMFLVKSLLIVSILFSTAYAEVIEGMVLSVTKKEIVIVTKDGEKKTFPLSPLVKMGRKEHEVLLLPRPGNIVILTINGGVLKEIRIKGMQQ